MAQNHVDDNIYYDNMEMMEQIEKSRNKSRLSAKNVQQTTNSIDPRKVMQNVEKPPALPPKKKNMQKTSPKPTDKKVETKITAIQRPLEHKSLPEKIVENDQQPVKTWAHPGILRTRSIVDEPLSPILEEESVMGDSQQGSPDCSENESYDRRSLTASDVFQSDSSVFYEACGDSVSKHENSSGEQSDKISLHSQHSEDSKSLNNFRNATTSKEFSLKEDKFYSASESSNSGSNFSNSKNFSNASESPSSQHDLEDSVEPYGMVDLAHLERIPDVKASISSSNKKHTRKPTRQSPNEIVEKRISQLRPPVMYDETVVYDNIDDYNGTHSTAVSSLDKRGVSTANQSASPKPRPKHSPRTSLPQAHGREERYNEKHIDDKRHHKISVPDRREDVNKTPVKSPTTNMPRQIQKRVIKETTRGQDLPLPPKPPIFSNLQNENDLYKDDANMYEEIHPRVDSVQSSKQSNEEMEKALNDIQEILESMNIPDVFGVQSQTLSTKKFPVANEDRQYEPPQYDNFSSMITENLSKKENTDHIYKPIAKTRDVSTSNVGNSNCGITRRSFGESERPYFERNETRTSTSNIQQSNPSFDVNRGVAPSHVKPNMERYQSSKHITADVTQHSTTTTQIFTANRNLSTGPNMPKENNFKTSKSSSDITTAENGRSNISSPQTNDGYRKSKSLDDSEKPMLPNIENDSTSRRTKSRESDGDSGMYSQNVGDITDEGLTMRSGSQYSDESMLDTSESLKGSTRSLGRLNSRERKKSPLRSKFKFRVRSKSQDRLPSDAQAQQSGNSDVDEDPKTRRRKGSRLSRRISRKTAERRGRSADRKSGGEDTEGESRSHNPVNFIIRKLLRKSREPTNDNSQTTRKVESTSSGYKAEKKTHDPPSSSTQQANQQEDPPREKQLISPPSRRARKMLHSRRTKDYDSSSDDDANSIQHSRENYDTRNSKYGAHRQCTTPDSASFRNRRRAHGHNNAPSSSDSEQEPYASSDMKGRSDSFNERRKNNSRTPENEKERNTRPNRVQHGRRRSEKRRLHSDSTFPNNSASQQQEKYKTLVSLNAQTLKKITEKWLTEWRNQLPVGGFLITSWSDVVLASKRPQCILGKSVIYVAHFSTNPDHKLACQIFHQGDVNSRLVRQLENCSTLTAHPNLCSVCSHFPCQIPGSLLNPGYGDRPLNALCVVLANVPAMSLADYIRRLAEEKEQKQVHKQILLMLLQLLQALDNLSSSGFRLANIRPEHLVVTQERGLLQILPHMDCADEQDTNGSFEPHGNLPIIQQIARLVTWMLDVGVNIHAVPLKQPQIESPHLFALQKVVYILTEPNFSADSRSVQSLAQCAIWGPMTSDEIDFTYKNAYDALEMWIDVKQAKLVTSIAVLFSGKSNSVPIYMFYKHQYFSQVNPDSLYQNLKILERI